MCCLPIWGPVLWREAWRPRVSEPGNQSFNSYLFNKYFECGPATVNKTPILLEFSSPAQETLTAQTSNQTGCCTLLQSAVKKNRAFEKKKGKKLRAERWYRQCVCLWGLLLSGRALRGPAERRPERSIFPVHTSLFWESCRALQSLGEMKPLLTTQEYWK